MSALKHAAATFGSRRVRMPDGHEAVDLDAPPLPEWVRRERAEIPAAADVPTVSLALPLQERAAGSFDGNSGPALREFIAIDQIAALVRAVTYGEMMEWCAELAKAGVLPDETKLAGALHRWATERS